MFHKRVRTLCPYAQEIGINLISPGRLKMLKEENKWWELNEERQEGRSRSRLLADHFPYCRILSTHYVAADIFRGRFSESNCEELTWQKVVWGSQVGSLEDEAGWVSGVGSSPSSNSQPPTTATTGWSTTTTTGLSTTTTTGWITTTATWDRQQPPPEINNNQRLVNLTADLFSRLLSASVKQGDAVSDSYYSHISKDELYRNL